MSPVCGILFKYLVKFSKQKDFFLQRLFKSVIFVVTLPPKKDFGIQKRKRKNIRFLKKNYFTPTPTVLVILAASVEGFSASHMQIFKK